MPYNLLDQVSVAASSSNIVGPNTGGFVLDGNPLVGPKFDHPILTPELTIDEILRQPCETHNQRVRREF